MREITVELQAKRSSVEEGWPEQLCVLRNPLQPLSRPLIRKTTPSQLIALDAELPCASEYPEGLMLP